MSGTKNYSPFQLINIINTTFSICLTVQTNM